jgi:hypothetical protein
MGEGVVSWSTGEEGGVSGGLIVMGDSGKIPGPNSYSCASLSRTISTGWHPWYSGQKTKPAYWEFTQRRQVGFFLHHAANLVHDPWKASSLRL